MYIYYIYVYIYIYYIIRCRRFWPAPAIRRSQIFQRIFQLISIRATSVGSSQDSPVRIQHDNMIQPISGQQLEENDFYSLRQRQSLSVAMVWKIEASCPHFLDKLSGSKHFGTCSRDGWCYHHSKISCIFQICFHGRTPQSCPPNLCMYVCMY